MKHLTSSTLLASALALSLFGLPGLSQPAQAEEVSLGRFFGACENAGTDIAAAVGEPCIIQSIINAAGEQIEGVTVKTLPTDWGAYYDQIKAAYAAGTAPDIHVMHAHMIPEFQEVNALADLTDDLASVGIDTADWADLAKAGVTYNGRIYGVPMDFNANLVHINMGLMAQAGLVKDGKAILPTSPEELLKQAEQFQKATGKAYLSGDFSQFITPLRMVMAGIWQQGGDVLDKDGNVTVDTPEARKAIAPLTQLFDLKLADPQLNYADSQQVFLNGDAGVLINGTWVVDLYNAEAAKPEVGLKDYAVADYFNLYGTPATWAANHIWVIPAKLKAENPEKYKAALKVAAFIYQHNADWARTGHLSVRKSVLDSEAYQNLPHRKEYTATASMARILPPSTHFMAMQEILNRELMSIWLSNKSVDDALADAQADIEDVMGK